MGYYYDASGNLPRTPGKTYVAIITGLHDRYLFERQFLTPHPDHPQQYYIPHEPTEGLILDVHGWLVQYNRHHWKTISTQAAIAYFKTQG